MRPVKRPLRLPTPPKVARLLAELEATERAAARLRDAIEHAREEAACPGCQRGRCGRHAPLFAELDM